GKENDATSKFTRAEISLNENRQLTYVRVETLDGNKDASHGFIYDPNSKNPGIDVYAPPQYHQYLGYFGPTPQGQRYLVQKTIQ
ncbi:hypothetical protein HYW54_01690, partial [Candidatus Gottesmanbacteria bacterium]|nr:hypothetical protein [Candidatus Gottesmanbacteria bacterium]